MILATVHKIFLQILPKRDFKPTFLRGCNGHGLTSKQLFSSFRAGLICMAVKFNVILFYSLADILLADS